MNEKSEHMCMCWWKKIGVFTYNNNKNSGIKRINDGAIKALGKDIRYENL